MSDTPKPDTRVLAESTERKLAQDSFLLGVDWTLEAIMKCGEVFEMSAKDAELFRIKARALIGAK